MATPPDVQDHEYAIRELTAAVKLLKESTEENEEGIKTNREDILVIKTKSGMLWAFFSMLGGATVSLVLKLVFKI